MAGAAREKGVGDRAAAVQCPPAEPPRLKVDDPPQDLSLFGCLFVSLSFSPNFHLPLSVSLPLVDRSTHTQAYFRARVAPTQLVDAL
eukprot:7862099-Pyramimonas_sp.AAC.2